MRLLSLENKLVFYILFYWIWISTRENTKALKTYSKYTREKALKISIIDLSQNWKLEILQLLKFFFNKLISNVLANKSWKFELIYSFRTEVIEFSFSVRPYLFSWKHVFSKFYCGLKKDILELKISTIKIKILLSRQFWNFDYAIGFGKGLVLISNTPKQIMFFVNLRVPAEV